MPQDGIEQLVELYRHYPNSLIAPVDYYAQTKVKPDFDNKEDWFNGETNIQGKTLWKNARLQNKALRQSGNAYEFELNYAGIPKSILHKLNGWWEFMGDALGFDNTEIAYRALKLKSPILVDEHNVAVCIDHWEWLRGTDENGTDREYNLNDPRFAWMLKMMDENKLPLIRDPKIDDKISLDYQIPKTLKQEEAVVWMKKHLERLVKLWIKEIVL
jgi:hypothetical protein